MARISGNAAEEKAFSAAPDDGGHVGENVIALTGVCSSIVSQLFRRLDGV
jgi:hypothetical protein